MEKLPIYAMEVFKTKLRRLAFQKRPYQEQTYNNSDVVHKRQSRLIVQKVPRIIVFLLYLSTNPLNSVKSLRLVWQQQLMPWKSQKQRRRLTKENIERECEELDDVHELLRDVAKRTFLGDNWICFVLQNTSCHEPGPVITPSSTNTSLIMHVH